LPPRPRTLRPSSTHSTGSKNIILQARTHSRTSECRLEQSRSLAGRTDTQHGRLSTVGLTRAIMNANKDHLSFQCQQDAFAAWCPLLRASPSSPTPPKRTKLPSISSHTLDTCARLSLYQHPVSHGGSSSPEYNSNKRGQRRRLRPAPTDRGRQNKAAIWLLLAADPQYSILTTSRLCALLENYTIRSLQRFE
jgi:hypothetical protein